MTRENITLLIAIIGAVGTIASWINSYIRSRNKLDVSLVKAFEPFNTIVLYLNFQNRSSLPVSINSVSIVVGDNAYQCSLISHAAYSSYQKGQHISDLMTLHFPVNLSPLSGTAGFVEFELPPEDLRMISTHLTLQVSTNRGNPAKKIFALDGWDNVAPFL